MKRLHYQNKHRCDPAQYILTNLVELEYVKQLKELLVLLIFLQLDVVLLQSVQGQLGLIVDVHLHGLKRAEPKVTHTILIPSPAHQGPDVGDDIVPVLPSFVVVATYEPVFMSPARHVQPFTTLALGTDVRTQSVDPRRP